MIPRLTTPDRPDDDAVPLFGTWRNAYGAVVICALLTMLFLYLFQGWPF